MGDAGAARPGRLPGGRPAAGVVRGAAGGLARRHDAPAGGGVAAGRAAHGLRGVAEERDVDGQRGRPLRRGDPAALEGGDGHRLGVDPGGAGGTGPRAGATADDHGGAVVGAVGDLRRVAEAAVVWVLRGEAVPGDGRLRAGTADGGVPQAGDAARGRRGDAGHGRAEPGDHRRAQLHGDDPDQSVDGGQLHGGAAGAAGGRRAEPRRGAALHPGAAGPGAGAGLRAGAGARRPDGGPVADRRDARLPAGARRSR